MGSEDLHGPVGGLATADSPGVLLEALGKVFGQRCGLEVGGQQCDKRVHPWASVALVEMKNEAEIGELLKRKSLQAW